MMDYERWEISPELELRMRDVARQLRHESTSTEAILWEKLRRKQLGYKFRRQVPIGPFVVDFLCATARLVVEVDGRFMNRSKKPITNVRHCLKHSDYASYEFPRRISKTIYLKW